VYVKNLTNFNVKIVVAYNFFNSKHLDLQQLGLNEVTDESFAEAMKSVNTAVTPTVIPTEVISILNDPKASKPEVIFLVQLFKWKLFNSLTNTIPEIKVLGNVRRTERVCRC